VDCRIVPLSMTLYVLKITDVVVVNLHFTDNDQPFDAYCCHMGTAIKHPVPDWVKQSFVIFDI